MTNKQLEIARKCIYACETGGQVYGNARYDCYVGNHTNSDKETACTIGAGGNHAGTAKKLVQSILEKYPSVFRVNDTAGIESDLKKSWESYDPGVGSAKAKCIQKIISAPEGIKCQDELLNNQILARVEKVKSMGVTEIDAQIFAAEIIHLGGYAAFERVLQKTSKPYSMDNIYKALKSDQNDTSSNNQVGDKKYWSRHEKIYGWLKEKLSNETTKGECKVSITEKDIIICGHGSGNPSTKNMYTYNSQRYSSVASNGKRKGVVCVLRLKALTDSGRVKYHDKYKTILGRNIYNQNLRNYVYKSYNGKYYSDCSSSICATFAQIGYNVSLLNTAGMYYSSLFEKVPVNISNGHITNPEILKVGDCLMYVGSDPSRPLQIGHVESVYEIGTSSSSSTPSNNTSSSNTGNNVSKGQKWLNDNYSSVVKKCLGGQLLEVDNEYGSKTRLVVVGVWKDVMNRKHGYSFTVGNPNFGNACRDAANKVQLKQGDSGTLVYLVQLILSARGFYTSKMDGSFGLGTEQAVRAYQRSKNLACDGVVGGSTLYSLMN